jgi:hypothetical protein
MKKNSLLILIIFLSAQAFGQIKPAEPKPQSNFEAFLGSAGSFSKKEIYPIGKVKGITVQVVKLININSEKDLSGLRLSGYKATTYSTDEKVAFLDIDEIEAYLKVLNYLQNKVLNTPSPELSVEYNYYSRGGFSSGAFNETKKKKWDLYLDMEKYGSSIFYLDLEDLPSLIDLITQAKAKL